MTKAVNVIGQIANLAEQTSNLTEKIEDITNADLVATNSEKEGGDATEKITAQAEEIPSDIITQPLLADNQLQEDNSRCCSIS